MFLLWPWKAREFDLDINLYIEFTFHLSKNFMLYIYSGAVPDCDPEQIQAQQEVP